MINGQCLAQSSIDAFCYAPIWMCNAELVPFGWSAADGGGGSRCIHSNTLIHARASTQSTALFGLHMICHTSRPLHSILPRADITLHRIFPPDINASIIAFPCRRARPPRATHITKCARALQYKCASQRMRIVYAMGLCLHRH